MKYRALKYIAKVWLTSAFITPIVALPVYFALQWLIDISDGLPKTPVQSFWDSYLYLFIMVLLGPLIPWVITLLFAKPIINSSLTLVTKKLILGAVPTILFAAIFLIGGSGNHFKAWQSVFEGWLSYTIAVALSSWFYQIGYQKTIVEKMDNAHTQF